MSLFCDLRSRVDIKRVLENYGMIINRHNKCLCPFHNDRKPSLCLVEHKQIFKCHVCGTGGDSIFFVAKFFGISNFEALKKINADMNVGLDIEEPKKNVFSDYKAKKIENERFKKWSEKSVNIVTDYYKKLFEQLNKTKKMSYDWSVLIKKIEYIDYLSNEIINATDKDKLNYKREVDKIERIMGGNNQR